MRLIRQIKLYFKEGNSDKVYEVDLCEAGEGEFIVNFRYGRRGQRLKEGTKTAFPESLEKAEQILDKLVLSKRTKGYRESMPIDEDEVATGSAQTTVVQSTTDRGSGSDIQRNHLGRRLTAILAGREQSKAWKLSRVIWRAGEMGGDNFQASLRKMEVRSEMDAYSLAWALGRSKDTAAVPRLKELAQSTDLSVQRIATAALLRCLAPADAEALASERRAALPDAIREKLEAPTTDAQTLAATIEACLQSEPAPHDYLYGLYLQAPFFDIAREAIYLVLKALPFKAPWFRAIRHIFKTAELWLDAEIFGIIAWRFEKTDAAFSAQWGNQVWDQATRKMLKVSKECAKPDSTLGYSNKTRAYMRRRVCRTMKRFGELNDPAAFITLATGVLMQFSDEQDQKVVRSESDYLWDSSTRRSTVVQKYFGPYAGYLSLNYLLYAHSERYVFFAGKTWRAVQAFVPSDTSGDALPPKREEAFPHLWNLAPDALEHLLANSRCGAVHEFAVKAWRDNPEFSQRATVDLILKLVSQPYRVTQNLGIELAEAAFDINQPDTALLLALLGCPVSTARSLALSWLVQCRAHFSQNTEFLASAMLLPYEDVHTDLRTWLGSQRPDAALLKHLVPSVVGGLLTLDPASDELEASQTHARLVRETLMIVAADQLGHIASPVLLALLQHRLSELHMLAAQCLSLSTDSVDSLPDELWERLFTSDTLFVREAGMRLFAKLSDDALLTRSEILASFCLSTQADIRQASWPIVQRLVGINPAFAQDIILQFYPLTLRAESRDGLHEDLYRLLTEYLQAHLTVIPAGSCFRMMESPYAAGQKLGFVLLQQYVDLDTVDMRRIAKLANQDHLAGRAYAWNYYREHVTRIRKEALDALRITNSPWEDTRAFAFEFFSEQFREEDWTPALLVHLCDSVRGDVQDFGKSMITRFFRNEDCQEYLIKLSQHPNVELQAFATNYLQRFASGDVERIRDLTPYFTTVLSLVNKGRIAKERIFQFIEAEACSSEPCAEMLLPLLKQISLTIAIGNKASCIRAIRNISLKWPQLTTPLTVIEPPVYVND